MRLSYSTRHLMDYVSKLVPNLSQKNGKIKRLLRLRLTLK